MKMRAVALAYGACLLLATAAWAATPKSATDRDAQAASAEALAHGASLPITWVPDWLMEPLSRAIADAGDPRDRKSGI